MKKHLMLIVVGAAMVGGHAGCQTTSPASGPTGPTWYYRTMLPPNATVAAIALGVSEEAAELAFGLPHFESEGPEGRTKIKTYYLFREDKRQRPLYCKLDVECRRLVDGGWVTVSVSRTWQ